jgi:hypothetical protein
MIEFAPFQKFVKGKSKIDTRQGTIDTSPEYKEFLDSLTQPAPPSTEPVTTDEVKTTPLIEYLRSQKAARAEKEKINREKVRLAKIVAVQAKANAQSAKLRAEKMQKVEVAAATSKVGESSKPSTSARGGRSGGKSAGKGKEVQRAKAQRQQHPRQEQQKAKEGTAIVLMGESSTIDIPVNPVPPQNASPVATTVVLNAANGGGNTGTPGLRGGRGRGRARPHGVYRGGRGGRRGAAGNEGKSPANVAEG